MVRIFAAALLAISLSACAISPPSSLFASLSSNDDQPARPEPQAEPKRAQQAGVGNSVGGIWDSMKSGLGFGGGTVKPGAPVDQELAAFDPETAQTLINNYRAQKGLKPLRLNPQLFDAALKHSQDLSKSDRISHYGSDGSDSWDRVRRTGYGPKVTAENVGTGQRSISEVFRGWQNSRDHNANLLLADAEEMGIAMVHAPDTQFKTFWTLVLGSPVGPNRVSSR